MRTHVRLYVKNGKALCPHGAQWKDVAECAQCADLERLEPGEAVICTPDIENLLDTVALMAHG